MQDYVVPVTVNVGGFDYFIPHYLHTDGLLQYLHC